MKYEQLQNEACEDGIDVIDYRFDNKRIKGLYCNGTIAIRKDIDTTTEKACVLAEEMGHHYTSVGNILDMSDARNCKQERQARLWAYNRLIGLRGIIKAYQSGCQDGHDMADLLGVTEEFLQECIDCYREKYGVCTQLDNYTIFFIPNLAVLEKV